jgi:ABC-2 type transport system ATP-binding protein
MAIVETEFLTRRFGELVVVDALTLSVEAGEVFGLLGANGAGKSTTIKMLTTLLPPTSGRARVAGFDISRRAADVRRSIGYVPQALSVDGSMTGYENLLVFAKLYDVPRAEQKSRVREALAFMGLDGAADQLVRHYSGGMIRRLEIAQSTLHRPRVLFLDEPTVGLDPVARQAVWEHIRELHDAYGTTIFLTTHYMEEADRLCGRVAIMKSGRLAVVGAPEELKARAGGGGATLDDVFAYYSGHVPETGGDYRETSIERRTASRLG